MSCIAAFYFAEGGEKVKQNDEYWIERWQKSKSFQVEKDQIKPKSYLFASFPKTNIYGFQDGQIRSLLMADAISRYERMAGYNVLFPVGYDSLGLTSFMESKKHSNSINDDIPHLFRDQMLRLGISIDEQKEIDLRHEAYLASLQLAFIELYEKGYIKYGQMVVCQEPKTKKIFDPYFDRDSFVKTEMNVFYLDIESVVPQVLEKIEHLPVSKTMKDDLKKILEPQYSLWIDFYVTNGSKMKIELKEPEFMGGISFICIHPDFVDFSLYTEYDEYEAIERYLSEENSVEFGVFSGNYAINPLTGKKIPIFISVQFAEGIYVGNPAISKKDATLAKQEGLPMISVVKNGIFVESDFLNGHPLEEGKDLLTASFLDAEIAVKHSYYLKNRILVSSLDTFGAILPFLQESEDQLFPLKNYLPITFSSKFRPVLDDIDIPGTLIGGSINHIFSSGMSSILSLLYDELGAGVSLFSEEAMQAFSDWNGMDLIALYPNETFEHLFFPLCVLAIIEKESQTVCPSLFHKIELIQPTLDIHMLPMNRKNNNIFELDLYLKEYSGDVLRLCFLNSDPNQALIFEESSLERSSQFIKGIEEYFQKPFAAENPILEERLSDFFKKETLSLEDKNLKEYLWQLLKFYKNILWKESCTKKQALLILKLWYPILPFTTEDIYADIFKGKTLLCDDGWGR